MLGRMDGLYPIIRRKRRPLLPEEPVVAGSLPGVALAGAAAPVVGAGAEKPQELKQDKPHEDVGTERGAAQAS